MKKAVVMGSGFGGLASAVRLINKGYHVTVLEARDQLGGRASVFKKQGYTFDAGPTVITAPYLINELFEMLGENPKDYFELLPIDPFYRIVFDDKSTFDYVGDEERLLENIRQLNPADVDGYKKLAEHTKRIFDIGYTKLADHPFDSVSSMLRVIPDMVKLQNYKSVYSLVSTYIKDERLRQAFSFEPLLVGGDPTKITSIYLLIHWLERKWGVHFVKGGTTALVNAFEKLLTKKGAQVLTNKAICKIDVSNGAVKGVITEDGSYYECDVLVSNGDPVKVYRDMIQPEHRSTHANWKLNLKSHSMSLFVAYFGTKKQYTDIKHHTILMGPRYEGLLKDIFRNKTLSNDFSLYLHAPTRTDSSMAPVGKECFYVLSPVPNNLSRINWKEEAAKYKDKVYTWLDKNYLPGLIDNLDVDLHVTPDYFQNELRSEHGAAFGIEPTLTQSAYFRFHNKSEDVNGLYFVGANTHPGAGIPGVLSSAKVIEKVVPKAETIMSWT